MNTENGKFKKLPPKSYLMECLDYDKETGRLTWRERPPSHFKSLQSCRRWNTRYVGKAALAGVTKSGHLAGLIDKSSYLAHRVVFKILHGKDPLFVDHINGNGADNRPLNIRSVSFTANCRNQKLRKGNSSGVSGVRRMKRDNRWRASIGVGGSSAYLGYFVDFRDAVAARREAEKHLGYHPNHGRVA